jgi:uncharacterized delta-60 repeat protein
MIDKSKGGEYKWGINKSMHLRVLTSILTSILFFLAASISAAPGDIDPTFGKGGRAKAAIPVPAGMDYVIAEAIAVQPDGKIVVVGRFWHDAISYWYGTIMARFMPNGALDSSFGVNGIISVVSSGIPYGDSSVGADIALQADGKIVLIGSRTIANGILVHRYTTTGQLDTTFGIGGMSLVPRTLPFPEGTEIAIQSDGRIVGVGWEYRLIPNTPFRTDEEIVVFRMNLNGSMDSTFGPTGNGVAKINFGYDRPNVVIQPDGKILVGGVLDHRPQIQDQVILARFDQLGSLDPTFGTGGQVILQDRGSTFGVSLQPDGKILQIVDNTLFRYRPDGSFDPNFGTNGVVSFEPNVFTLTFGSSVFARSGKIFLTGIGFDGGFGSASVRLNQNGSLDNSFGAGGMSVVPSDGGPIGGIQTDGKILLAGATDSIMSVVRILAPDITVSGRVSTRFGRGLRGGTIAVIDSSGVRRTATTNIFGFYSFESLQAGEIYTFAVESRRYIFQPQTIKIEENLTGLNFVATE